MFAPATVAELSEIIRGQAGQRLPLLPRGGGTMMHLGLPAHPSSTVVELGKLNQVIDFPARDLTITVQAGMTLEALRATLAAQDQWVPIDVPFPSRATVGGAIAANAYGPRRHAWGSWRDYVIGLSYMNAEGRECKAGGRVVKNVAGYDLGKLFTGSFGTLGILTQVTLKVRPRPQSTVLLVIPAESSELAAILAAVRETATCPTVVSIRSDQNGTKLFIGMEESRAAVTWQRTIVREALGPRFCRDVTELVDAAADAAVAGLTDACWPGEGASLRAHLLPSRLLAWWEHARSACENWCLHTCAGVAFGWSPAISPDAIAAMRRQAEAVGGFVEVLRYPDDGKSPDLLWGPPGPDRATVREVKRRFDAHGIFNPGRWWCDAG